MNETRAQTLYPAKARLTSSRFLPHESCPRSLKYLKRTHFSDGHTGREFQRKLLYTIDNCIVSMRSNPVQTLSGTNPFSPPAVNVRADGAKHRIPPSSKTRHGSHGMPGLAPTRPKHGPTQENREAGSHAPPASNNCLADPNEEPYYPRHAEMR